MALSLLYSTRIRIVSNSPHFCRIRIWNRIEKIWKIEYEYIHLTLSLKTNTNTDIHIGVLPNTNSDNWISRHPNPSLKLIDQASSLLHYSLTLPLWEKSTADCWLVTGADLFWEKSTAGWWLISQTNRAFKVRLMTSVLAAICTWSRVKMLVSWI